MLFLILIIGGFLRLIRYPPIWIVDSARDLLVGLHISRYHEYPVIGHWAYGLNIPYPPYYYYFLGFLSKISADPFFTFLIFISFQVLGIFIIYKIGTLLYNRKTGLLTAFLFSVSAIMVVTGSMIETVFFNIPVFLLSFWMFVLFNKSKNPKFAFISIFLILLSGSIHASSIPFLFLYLFLEMILLGKKNINLIIKLLAFTLLAALIIYLPLLNFYGIKGIILQSGLKHTFIPQNNLVSAFANNSGYLLRLIFFSDITAIVYFAAGIIVLTVLLMFSGFKKIKPLFLPLGFIAYLLFIASISGKNIYLHYLSLLIPFVFLTTSFLLTENLKSGRIIFKAITSTVALLLFFLFINNLNGKVNWVYGDYKIYEKLADEIKTDFDLKQNKLAADKNFSYQSIVITSKDNYKNSFLLWYFLEKKYGQKQAKIADSDKDFLRLINGDVIYLLCDLRPDPAFLDPCKYEFQKDYPGYKYLYALSPVDKDYATLVFQK